MDNLIAFQNIIVRYHYIVAGGEHNKLVNYANRKDLMFDLLKAVRTDDPKHKTAVLSALDAQEVDINNHNKGLRSDSPGTRYYDLRGIEAFRSLLDNDLDTAIKWIVNYLYTEADDNYRWYSSRGHDGVKEPSLDDIHAEVMGTANGSDLLLLTMEKQSSELAKVKLENANLVEKIIGPGLQLHKLTPHSRT